MDNVNSQTELRRSSSASLSRGLLEVLSAKVGAVEKLNSTPPTWVRFISGSLGFFSSTLSLVIPAIILIILDRLIPSESPSSLWSLFGLGVGIIISICLIDLMRMRALERYYVNVRGLVLYQDSCFAVFWMFGIAFLHPLLTLVPIMAAVSLLIFWLLRKPRDTKYNTANVQKNLDPLMIETVGLGPAYINKSMLGEIRLEEQPDFQTIGQSSWLHLVQFSAILSSVILTAWLHISGSISLGTMIAVIFLNQFIVSAFVRFFQIQCLKPVRADFSDLSLGGEFDKTAHSPKTGSSDDLGLLQIDNLEGKGFAPFSADLFQGLCLALIGPSGSGKSEILKAVATGDFEEGKISYKGRNWGRNHGRMTSLGYAPPNAILLDGTVVENVTCFDPKAGSLSAIEMIRKLDPYEDVFGEIDFANESINPAINAQAQIVSIARAFWTNPDIIVLDTPEIYLDKASRASLMALILRAKTQGKIVILATDDDYLMSAADELVKLERGVVTDRGPMDEVLERHHQRWVRVSFEPTKADAFRLTLWLDSQFPLGMSCDLKNRVKLAAQDMLFLAPRDAILDANSEVLFDVRMSTDEIFITMHDRGDLLIADRISADLRQDFDRVENASDGFEQTLCEGYRQIAARFHVDRISNVLKGRSSGQ